MTTGAVESEVEVVLEPLAALPVWALATTNVTAADSATAPAMVQLVNRVMRRTPSSRVFGLGSTVAPSDPAQRALRH
jgi:hypothetical protein